MQLQDGALILFQGDSITDSGRVRDDHWHVGNGYAHFVSAWLTAKYPEKNLRFLNRGVGGDRVIDLKERWQRDCLDIKPDWVSILIGINDTWRRYDQNEITTTESFEWEYRGILRQTREQTAARIILCEPFLLPYPADRRAWREDLNPKIQAVHKLAAEFDALLVPLDYKFGKLVRVRPPQTWSEDGVHVTEAGAAFIAQQWIATIENVTGSTT